MSKFDSTRKFGEGPVRTFRFGSCDTYDIEKTKRPGYYVIGTINYVVLFSKNAMSVDWGTNREKWCRNDPERVVAEARRILGLM